MLSGGTPTAIPVTPGTGSPNIGTTTEPPMAQHLCKQSGWTPWMNSHKPTASDNDDIEFLPTLVKQHSYCGQDQIAYIQCRQVSNEMSYDQGDDKLTVCNTKAGFACYASLQGDGRCEDYEVRVYCQCAQTSKFLSKPEFMI